MGMMKNLKLRSRTCAFLAISFFASNILSADDCCYYQEDNCCQTNWACWIGGALLGAAAGAGTGYAAGRHHGDKGKKGRRGETGPTGPTGPTGAVGAIGPTGPVGQTGLQGIPGINGINGINGQNGDPDTLINTTDALTVTITDNAIIDGAANTLELSSVLIDPQGSVFAGPAIDDTAPVDGTAIFSFLAGQPKFIGSYTLLLTVTTPSSAAVAIGTFDLNGEVVTIPSADWVAGQTVVLNFTFP